MRKAFTLVEMLIAAAILAILAAIAVPNLLQAQSRAKISRVKNDLRTIDVALNAYMLDQKNYPYPKCASIDGFAATWIYFAYELSTPVAYLPTTQLLDPFGAPNPWHQFGGALATITRLPYAYTNFGGSWGNQSLSKDQRRRAFVIYSAGPNCRLDWPEYGFVSGAPGNYQLAPFGSPGTIAGWSSIYDPTNGSISGGDIVRFGGNLPSHPSNSDSVF